MIENFTRGKYLGFHITVKIDQLNVTGKNLESLKIKNPVRQLKSAQKFSLFYDLYAEKSKIPVHESIDRRRNYYTQSAPFQLPGLHLENPRFNHSWPFSALISSN